MHRMLIAIRSLPAAPEAEQYGYADLLHTDPNGAADLFKSDMYQNLTQSIRTWLPDIVRVQPQARDLVVTQLHWLDSCVTSLTKDRMEKWMWKRTLCSAVEVILERIQRHAESMLHFSSCSVSSFLFICAAQRSVWPS